MVSRTTISDCIANCGLSGNNYVGGIIGSGYEFEEGRSTVSNCYSIVSIANYKQYMGAIAGCNVGTFTNNYFVSNDLEGINRVSYKGKAQPITYEELVQTVGIPVELQSFTLTFVVDDKIIKTMEFSYGDSFGTEVYPELPKKSGYDGKWDITELKNLCFDTVVTAVYTPYLTSIESEELRKNDRPIILVEGNFGTDDVVFLSKVDLNDSMKEEFATSGELIEYWRFTFSDDGQVRHTIRFLPEKGNENATMFIKSDGIWQRVETEEFGSYLMFETTGTVIELAVVSNGLNVMFWICFIVGIILLVLLGLFLQKKLHIFTHIYKFISRRWLALLSGCAILGLLIVGLMVMLPKLHNGMEIAAVIKNTLNQENQSMEMELKIEASDVQLEIQTDLYNLKQNNKQFLVLEVNDAPVYVCKENIFFENGKGFQIGVKWDGENSILNQIQDIYSSAEIVRREIDGEVIYSVTAENEKGKKLISALMPSLGQNLSSVEMVELHITTYNYKIQQIEITGNANVKDSMDTNVTLEAKFSNFETLNRNEYVIPGEIVAAVEKAKTSPLPEFGKDLYRLFVAWMDYNGKDEVKGTVSLDTSCGPIVFKAELPWSSKGMETEEIINPEEIVELPEVIYTICLEGDFSCEKKANSYIYTLQLEEDTIKKLAGMISPEVVTETVNLSNGNIYVTVENEKVSSLEVDIEGTIMVLLVEVEASVNAVYTFE